MPLVVPPPEDWTDTVVFAEAAVVPLAPVQVIPYDLFPVTAPVLLLPLVAMAPAQAPEAVQVLALVDDQVSIEAAPLATVVGLAVSLTEGLLPEVPPAEEATTKVNAGRQVEVLLSLTQSSTFAELPTFAAVGVPLSRPVLALRLSQDGACHRRKNSDSLFGFETVGVNEYADPTVAVLEGAPDMLKGTEANAVPRVPHATATVAAAHTRSLRDEKVRLGCLADRSMSTPF